MLPVSLASTVCRRIELMRWSYRGNFPVLYVVHSRTLLIITYYFSPVLLQLHHGEQYAPCDYAYIVVCAIIVLIQLDGFRSSLPRPIRPVWVYFSPWKTVDIMWVENQSSRSCAAGQWFDALRLSSYVSAPRVTVKSNLSLRAIFQFFRSMIILKFLTYTCIHIFIFVL